MIFTVEIRHILRVLVLKLTALELPFAFHLLLEVRLVTLHSSLEASLPPWLEIDVLNHVIWNIRQVKKDHNQIGLLPADVLAPLRHFHLAINLAHLLLQAILYEVLAVYRIGADVGELVRVVRVGEHLVPGCALHRLDGHRDGAEALNGIRIGRLEAEVLLQVRIFEDDLFGTRKLYGFEKVWQVLVDHHGRVFIGHTNLLQILIQKLVDKVNQNRYH